MLLTPETNALALLHDKIAPPVERDFLKMLYEVDRNFPAVEVIWIMWTLIGFLMIVLVLLNVVQDLLVEAICQGSDE